MGPQHFTRKKTVRRFDGRNYHDLNWEEMSLVQVEPAHAMNLKPEMIYVWFSFSVVS